MFDKWSQLGNANAPERITQTKPPTTPHIKANFSGKSYIFVAKVIYLSLLLQVLDQLEPGMSPNRGRVLKELIAPVMTVSTHELKTNAIDQTEFKLRKMYCSKLAKDLIHCYKFEFIWKGMEHAFNSKHIIWNCPPLLTSPKLF